MLTTNVFMKTCKGDPSMSEIKTNIDFFEWLVENLIHNKSNNVIWKLKRQKTEYRNDEEPWVEVSLLIDDKYYSDFITKSQLTPDTLKEWNTILKSALNSKSTDYNDKAKVIHNAIRTIIESGQELDPELIELRNELQQKGL